MDWIESAKLLAEKFPMKNQICLFICASVLILQNSARAEQVPSFETAMAAKRDLWGEAAMGQPNGASYEFFEKLLPPPRYVNADFRYYPIVLSAPNAKVKARLISDGSGANLRGGTRSWKDVGTPVTFRVGSDEFKFGSIPNRLEHPKLAEGYLPIVQIDYLHPTPQEPTETLSMDRRKTTPSPTENYRLESFAATDPVLAANGVVFVKFSLAQGTKGVISADIDSASGLKFADGKVTDDKGQTVACFDKNWKWERGSAHAKLTTNNFVTLAIPTKPLAPSAGFNFTGTTYAEQRESCSDTWRQILSQGMNIETPETIVNNAWRNLIIQNFQLINGSRINYSAGNQYEAVYEAEGSEAALAMLVWGYEKDMRRLMLPLFDFTRKGLEFHQAGFKLNDICRYYWQTRDATVFSEFESRWKKEAERLDKNRTGEHGLFPKEQYCGDVHTFVQSLNVSSKAWRAMRDLGAVLGEIGEKELSTHYTEESAAFRKIVLSAIEKSADHSTTPPFVPIALYSNESAHDPIFGTRLASYWNIIIGYTIASGIFPVGSPEETWLPHYQEQHGGLCMGMLRSGGAEFTFWNSPSRINPLYGTKYALDTLRRDEPERALVSLYGMLAQGFTRNTFIGAEGCSLLPCDDGGRVFYCPPNSAANAHFLSMLRYSLVQDSDLDDNGKPETLRLCFATPKRWLEDGQSFKVERAPTAWGMVSVKMESHLSKGEVVAEVDLPSRNVAEKILLRARVPDGWKVSSAAAGSTNLKADANGTADISLLKGNQVIRFIVQKI